jgi:hypothetical protein
MKTKLEQEPAKLSQGDRGEKKERRDQPDPFAPRAHPERTYS